MESAKHPGPASFVAWVATTKPMPSSPLTRQADLTGPGVGHGRPSCGRCSPAVGRGPGVLRYAAYITVTTRYRIYSIHCHFSDSVSVPCFYNLQVFRSSDFLECPWPDRPDSVPRNLHVSVFFPGLRTESFAPAAPWVSDSRRQRAGAVHTLGVVCDEGSVRWQCDGRALLV